MANGQHTQLRRLCDRSSAAPCAASSNFDPTSAMPGTPTICRDSGGKQEEDTPPRELQLSWSKGEPPQFFDVTKAALTLATLHRGNYYKLAPEARMFELLPAAYSTLDRLVDSLKAYHKGWSGYKLGLHTLLALAGNEHIAKTGQIGWFQHASHPVYPKARIMFFQAKSLTYDKSRAFIATTPAMREVLSKTSCDWLGSFPTEKVLPIQVIELRAASTSKTHLACEPKQILTELGGVVLIVWKSRLFILPVVEFGKGLLCAGSAKCGWNVLDNVRCSRVREYLDPHRIQAKVLIQGLLAYVHRHWPESSLATSWVKCYAEVVESHRASSQDADRASSSTEDFHALPPVPSCSEGAETATVCELGTGEKRRSTLAEGKIPKPPKRQNPEMPLGLTGSNKPSSRGLRDHHVLDTKDATPSMNANAFFVRNTTQERIAFFQGLKLGSTAQQQLFDELNSETRIFIVAKGTRAIQKRYLQQLTTDQSDTAKGQIKGKTWKAMLDAIQAKKDRTQRNVERDRAKKIHVKSGQIQKASTKSDTSRRGVTTSKRPVETHDRDAPPKKARKV